MNRIKVLLGVICLSLLLSSCIPFTGEIEQLVDESLGLSGGENYGQDPDLYSGGKSDPSFLNNEIIGFGMGSSTNLRVSDVNLAYADMRSMGVRLVREEIPMVDVQKGKGVYDFNGRWNLDRMIPAAKNNNLAILGLLCYGPGVSYDSDGAFLELWADYVQAVVGRYGDTIDYWEIGNEMNSLRFWKKVRRNAESIEINIYAKMLELAFAIIKHDDPNDVVILGGLILGPGPGDTFIPPLVFVNELAKYTNGRKYDAIALHPYWDIDMPETPRSHLIVEEQHAFSMMEYINIFGQDIQRLNGEPIPIWITEVGYSQHSLDTLGERHDLSPEAIQAALLARVYTSLFSLPWVEAVFWYTYENDPTGQSFEVKESSKTIFQTISEVLIGSKPLGYFPIYNNSGLPVENLYDFRFLKPSGDIVSIYWKNNSDVDFVMALLEEPVVDPVMGFGLETGMGYPGIPVYESVTNLGIFEIPEILIGKMDQDTRLVIQDEPQKDFGKGQIAYIVNGNVWYQNLETGETHQLTDDANWEEDHVNVYQSVSFSPSGRYLAFGYGNYHERTIETHIYDTTNMEEVINVGEQMLIGWRENEDILLLGHNTPYCEPPDEYGFSSTNEEDITFIVYSFDAATGRSSELTRIPGGLRFPRGMAANHDFMIFQSCPCGFFECSWVSEAFNEQGKKVSNEMSISNNYSADLNFAIPIFINIHGLESAPLKILNRNTNTTDEIYFKEGKFPATARWTPGDEWIIFWLGDVEAWDYRSNLMMIRPDGSEVREITPTPGLTMGFYPDGRLMLLSQSNDRLTLYDLTSGETETLAELDLNLDFSDITWSINPN